MIRFAAGRIIALRHSDVVTFSHFCAQKLRCIRVRASRLEAVTGILSDFISATAQNPPTEPAPEKGAFQLNCVRRILVEIASTEVSLVDSLRALIQGDLDICVH